MTESAVWPCLTRLLIKSHTFSLQSVVCLFVVHFLLSFAHLFVRSFVCLFSCCVVSLPLVVVSILLRHHATSFAVSRLSSSLSSCRHLALSRFVSSRLISSCLASSLHPAPSCILPRPLCLFDCCVVAFHLVTASFCLVDPLVSSSPRRVVVVVASRHVL